MEVVDVSVHSPALHKAEQEDEPSLGQEHWSRSAEVCEPASSDLCKQTCRAAAMGQSQAEGWEGPVTSSALGLTGSRTQVIQPWHSTSGGWYEAGAVPDS